MLASLADLVTWHRLGSVLHADPCPQCHAGQCAKLDMLAYRRTYSFRGGTAVEMCKVRAYHAHGLCACAAPEATANCRLLDSRAAYLKHLDHPGSAAVLHRAPELMDGKRVVPLQRGLAVRG